MANLDRIEAEHSTAPRTRQGERYANTNEVRDNGSQQYCQPTLIKLKFPRFRGEEDTTSWLCRVEQLFNFHHTPEGERVALASFRLEGDAQLCDGLHARFGPTQFEDFFGDLTKLQQVGSVCNYQTQFENLLSKVVSLPQSHQISCFISGLKDTIKADVLAGRPTSLTSAIGLARLYEVQNTSQRHFTTGGEVKKIDSGTKQATSNNISTPPIRRMSTTELQEHRAKGLCYNCNETFVPGHQCRKLFLIEVCTEEDGGDFIMDEADAIQEDVEAVPEISLHAIAGTMRIQPKTGEHFKVMVASEKKLSSQGLCT
ncbi:hypothetical protein ACOSQ2_004151 [Xanthoceras sorbifolium]